MKVFFIDTPFGSIWQTDIAQFYENILSNHRENIIENRLFKRFNISKPNHKTYTLGMLSLASSLKAAGYDIKYILAENNTNFLDEINNNDIICFSIKTTTINQCLNLAKKIKFTYPNTTIIFGGPHATSLYEKIISYPFIDIVVIGEGEKTLLEIVQTIEKKQPVNNIAGIVCKNNGSFIKTADRKLSDFNELVSINYNLLPYSINDFYIYYETRRGCNYGCSYCASHYLWKKKTRTQSADISYKNLFNLSKQLKKNTLVHIVNSSFGFDPEDIKLCKLLIENPIDLSFSCDICASQISENMVKLMYDAGFKMFSIGMESAAAEVLKKNHRPPFKFVEKACSLIKNCTDAFIKGYWIIGLPGETHETIKTTKNTIIRLINQNLLDLPCEHIFVPYPGSNVFTNPEKYDYTIYHKDWDFYDSRSFPLPAESKYFSMGDAYLAYLDILKTQCELYGISPKFYEKPVSNKFINFLEHKKHLT